MNTTTKILIVLLTLFLSACGGEKSDSTTTPALPTLTGTFTNGPIVGLHYKTTTSEGVTNVLGEFKYKTGEAVTFSLGGIVLGSTTGASQITAFDFFNLTPPTQQIDFNKLLSNKALPSDFDRAINISNLLVVLGKDRNPDNGIDLGTLDSTIINTNLDFESHYDNFIMSRSMQKFVTRNNITRILTRGTVNGILYVFPSGNDLLNTDAKFYSIALKQLYRSLNLTVDASLNKRNDYDRLNNGSVERIDYISRDEITGDIRSAGTDKDNDGIVSSSFSVTRTINPITFQTLYLQDPTDDNDLSDAFGNQFKDTFDNRGNQTNVHFEAEDSSSASAILNYNINDNLIKSTVDFFDQSIITTFNYNNSNLLASKNMELMDSNGKVTATTLTNYRYDSHNHLLTEQASSHTVEDNKNNTKSKTYQYDANDNLLSRVISEDHNGDGLINKKIFLTMTYDNAGNILSASSRIDSDNDGTIDEKTVNFSTYNSNNQELTYIKKTIKKGVLKSEKSNIYTYDAQGRGLTETLLVDINGKGAFVIDRTFDYTYDANGNLIKEVLTNDTNTQTTTDTRYDNKGNVIEIIESTLNNGNVSVVVKKTTEYQEYSDVNLSNLLARNSEYTLHLLLNRF